MENGKYPPGSVWKAIGSSIGPVRLGMPRQLENMDHAIPNHVALERLSHRHRLEQCGRAVVLRFDGLLKLFGGDFGSH